SVISVRIVFPPLVLLVSPNAGAQQPGCDARIPVNVVLSDASLIRHLQQDAFVARSGENSLAIRSVESDAASRRIVVVVENGKHVNAAARQMDMSILARILGDARTEDSFAFVTATGPLKKIPFGAPRESLVTAPKDLLSPDKATG